MSGFDLGLGILGAVASVDVAIKTYKRIAEKCSAFKNAEREICERSTRLLSNCLQLEIQLDIYRNVQERLDERSQIIQTQVLESVASRLGSASDRLDSLVKNWSSDLPSNQPLTELALSRLKRSKYVVLKSRLDMSMNEIESYLRFSLNPLWLIIMKAQTEKFDDDLDRAKIQGQSEGKQMIAAAKIVRHPLKDINSTRVFLPPAKLKSANTIEIAFSSAKLVEIDNKWRLLDAISATDVSKNTVRELAVRLKGANPSTFSLLTCLGAVHDEEMNEFNLVFRMPDNTSILETLRTRLIANETVHSLSDRFRLATQLARAVLYIHTFDMVHKNIQPENIILFQDEVSTLGSAFLLGFGRFRRQADTTRLEGDTDWKKNLYRHPERQGSKIHERYVMQHDIYSLGVCLLEIGLWTSFVEYGNAHENPTLSQTYGFPVENPNGFTYSEIIKSRLLSLTTIELPAKMGTKYARIVESCLTCLDVGNEEFSDESELEDDDAIVSVRYMEKVLLRLSEISV